MYSILVTDLIVIIAFDEHCSNDCISPSVRAWGDLLVKLTLVPLVYCLHRVGGSKEESEESDTGGSNKETLFKTYVEVV